MAEAGVRASPVEVAALSVIPDGAVSVRIAGEEVWLLAQRAVYWPAAGTLLVCDLHLGKVESYASFGLPLPEVMEKQLQCLDEAVAAVKPRRVLVLGDLLHAPAGLTEQMLEQVRVWREGHGCEFAVVPGNHDRRLEKVARWWGMTLLQERHDEGPFTFVHEPQEIARRFVFAGHVHPVVRLGTKASRMKLWCFVVDRNGAEGVCTLPAFCDFTSGGVVEREVAGRRVFAIAGGRVADVSARQGEPASL